MIWAIHVFPLFSLKRRNREEQNKRTVKSTMTREMLTILAFTLSPFSLPLFPQAYPSSFMPSYDTPAHQSASATAHGQLEELANQIYVVHGILHFKATDPCCNKQNVCLVTDMLKETILLEKKNTNSTWQTRHQKTGGRLPSVQFPAKVLCPEE